MNRIKRYVKPALHNIFQNKIYALFCLIGTALTFVFIVIILQLTYSLISDQPPANNASRIIQLSEFYDTAGDYIGGLQPEDMGVVIKKINSVEGCSFLNIELITFSIGTTLYTGDIAFVNGEFWEINNFNFIKGRNFNSKECADKKKYIVIKQSLSKACFGTSDAIGQKIIVQGIEYEIIGIVDNYSFVSSPSENAILWVPYTYNKFVPSYNDYYTYSILFSKNHDIQDIKTDLALAINDHFRQQNISVDTTKLNTLSELKMKFIGNDLFVYGGAILAIIILLAIPALNIVTINTANTNNRAVEIALKRAMGASRFSAFMQILFENFILVFIGAFLGVLLMKPLASFLENVILGDLLTDGVTLVSDINYSVVFVGVLPLIFIFNILSGGIPAYIISKMNIVEILKGGIK